MLYAGLVSVASVTVGVGEEVVEAAGMPWAFTTYEGRRVHNLPPQMLEVLDDVEEAGVTPAGR